MSRTPPPARGAEPQGLLPDVDGQSHSGSPTRFSPRRLLRCSQVGLGGGGHSGPHGHAGCHQQGALALLPAPLRTPPPFHTLSNDFIYSPDTEHLPLLRAPGPPSQRSPRGLCRPGSRLVPLSGAGCQGRDLPGGSSRSLPFPGQPAGLSCPRGQFRLAQAPQGQLGGRPHSLSPCPCRTFG